MYLSAISVTNISQSFTYKMAAKINWHGYGTKFYVTVTLSVLQTFIERSAGLRLCSSETAAAVHPPHGPSKVRRRCPRYMESAVRL